MKIGLYFGSFNPIHIGHLIIGNFVLQHSNLNQVWYVVSPQNPLKPSGSLLNEYQRLYLVQMAIQDETNLKASDIEFRLPRPSFTIDTLTYLKEKYPEHEFSVIMGSDSFQNISKWKNPEAILENYSLFIYLRPGFPVEETATRYNVSILKAPLLEISATYIRETLKAGKSVRYLLPENVRIEIERNGYYRN